MTQASELIQRLGGFKIVAEITGVSRNGVQRWTYPNASGWVHGIPLRYWAALQRNAESRGLALTTDDLAATAGQAPPEALPVKRRKAA
jgi:putative alpha-1,2-mannosidase